MADVKTTRQGTEHQSTEERNQPAKKTQEQGRTGLQRRGETMSSLFSLSPRDFFSMNPFSLMRRISEEMDRTFSDVLGGRGTQRGENLLWAPAVEVSEQEGKLKVTAELPGLQPDDVKVEIAEGALVIQGERKQEHQEEREGVYHSERSYGRFYRRIPVPESAKIDDAEAQFKNGILEVTIPVPQTQQQTGRQIPVRSSEGQPTSGKGTQRPAA